MSLIPGQIPAETQSTSNRHDLKILTELQYGLYVRRGKDAPPYAKKIAALAFVVYVAEQESLFSEMHHVQLSKILNFLGFKKGDYALFFNNQDCKQPIKTLLSFGAAPFPAEQTITTHTITTMLNQPECKREVLNVIQGLQKN